MHFYTTTENEGGNAYSWEDVFWVLPRDSSIGTPLRRWREGAPQRNNHLYTTDPNTRPGWLFERIECNVLSTSAPGSVAMYSRFNPATGDHLLTTDPNEGNPDFITDGVTPPFGVYPNKNAAEGTVPFFRYDAVPHGRVATHYALYRRSVIFKDFWVYRGNQQVLDHWRTCFYRDYGPPDPTDTIAPA